MISMAMGYPFCDFKTDDLAKLSAIKYLSSADSFIYLRLGKPFTNTYREKIEGRLEIKIK